MVGHLHTARHSLQHASKELRGHNLLRTDCNGATLLNLWYRRLCSGSKGNVRLDMAVHAWGHMMHEQEACDLVLPFESLTLLRVICSNDISLRIRQFWFGGHWVHWIFFLLQGQLGRTAKTPLASAAGLRLSGPRARDD